MLARLDQHFTGAGLVRREDTSLTRRRTESRLSPLHPCPPETDDISRTEHVEEVTQDEEVPRQPRRLEASRLQRHNAPGGAPCRWREVASGLRDRFRSLKDGTSDPPVSQEPGGRCFPGESPSTAATIACRTDTASCGMPTPGPAVVPRRAGKRRETTGFYANANAQPDGWFVASAQVTESHAATLPRWGSRVRIPSSAPQEDPHEGPRGPSLVEGSPRWIERSPQCRTRLRRQGHESDRSVDRGRIG